MFMKKILSYLFVFLMVVVAAGSIDSKVSAVAVEKINICHKTGNTWMLMNTPAGPSLDGHLGHGDFLYTGPEGEANDAWCIANVPDTTPVDVCLNVDGVQEQGPCADDTCVDDGGIWNNEAQTCDHPIVDACPNILEVQPTVPEGMVLDVHGNCVDADGGPQEVGDPTLYAMKIVCPAETDLPNWAGSAMTIGATTGTDFLANHPQCHLQTNWQFETFSRGPSNPNDPNPTSSGSDVGPAGAPWTTMSNPTDANGVTSMTLPTNAWHVWVREVLKDGYIPFSGDDSVSEDPSAEMYCGSDVSDYDNLERLDSPFAGNYYCVAFNVPEDSGTPQDNTCIEPTAVENGDKITTINVTNEPVEVQAVLDANYSGLNKITSETGIQSWALNGAGTVTFSVKLLGASAGNTNDFGYYFNGDTSTFVSMMTVPGNTNPAGTTVGPIVVDTTGKTSIAFAIKSGDTTWASQYGLNTDTKDHVAVYNPSTNVYAMAFEDLSGLGDADYNDLVAELTVVGCTEGTTCTPDDNASVVSDATTMVGANPAALLTFIHPGWTASIPGASWIWATNPVESPTNDGDNTKVFTKTFTINGTPTAGTLDIAVDNNYSVKVNGTPVPVVFDQNNFQSGTQDSYNIASLLVTGVNTLEITATNQEDEAQSSDPAENPAGVMFKLTWSSDCDTPPPTECPEGYTGTYPECVPPVEVDPTSDLRVLKTVDDATPDVAQHITYTINIHNFGPNTATGVTVDESLPPLTNYFSDTPSQGTYDHNTGLWAVGTILSGADATLTVTVSVNSGTEGDTITNTATITHNDVTDTDHESDSDSVDVLVNTNGGGDSELCTDPAATNTGGALPCVYQNSKKSSSSTGGSTPKGAPQVLGAETSVCNWDIKTYMRTHYKNDPDQVKILQKDLLNGYMHLNIPVDGVYGPKTEAGVKAFQISHKDKILTPWNLTLPTGIFYKTTLVEAKNTICPESILPIPKDLINWSDNKVEVPSAL